MKIKIVLMYCLFLASAVCLLAPALSNSQPAGKKQWPASREQAKDAVAAFTATLTRSGYDRDFRNRLSGSCDSAKAAVSEEGGIDIPKEVVIMFFEPEAYQNRFGFSLPPFNSHAHTTYKYTDDAYFQCCFPKFRLFRLTTGPHVSKTAPRQTWNKKTLAVAFSAALTRSGYDRDFRNQLTASCDSAKQAVAEEGNIDIPAEVQMMFHENQLNEKYHIFSLPPFDANARTEHQYTDHFMGLYDEW
jgi:hypothetical protein